MNMKETAGAEVGRVLALTHKPEHGWPHGCYTSHQSPRAGDPGTGTGGASEWPAGIPPDQCLCRARQRERECVSMIELQVRAVVSV